MLATVIVRSLVCRIPYKIAISYSILLAVVYSRLVISLHHDSTLEALVKSTIHELKLMISHTL